eukprot:3921422-Rhodomonas_salina.2
MSRLVADELKWPALLVQDVSDLFLRLCFTFSQIRAPSRTVPKAFNFPQLAQEKISAQTGVRAPVDSCARGLTSKGGGGSVERGGIRTGSLAPFQ